MSLSGLLKADHLYYLLPPVGKSPTLQDITCKNLVNCWKPLRTHNTTAWLVTASATVLKSVWDWAISSQAPLKKGEGSTTR
jgi:hypothetical protein